MIASQELDDLDWDLKEFFPEHNDERVDVVRFGRAMAPFDPVRCEAFLHALLDDPRSEEQVAQ